MAWLRFCFFSSSSFRSTFLKQMKLIHGRGFKVDEKRRLVPFIHRQILSVVRCICRAMRILSINFQEDQNEVYYRSVGNSMNRNG
jgi:hypothetical protein